MFKELIQQATETQPQSAKQQAIHLQQAKMLRYAILRYDFIFLRGLLSSALW